MVEDADGNVVDDANVTFDGVEGLSHNVTDGEYELNVTADNYVDSSQNVTVDGADETFTVTLSEDEEPVISGSSNDEPESSIAPFAGAGLVVIVVFCFIALFGIKRIIK